MENRFRRETDKVVRKLISRLLEHAPDVADNLVLGCLNQLGISLSASTENNKYLEFKDLNKLVEQLRIQGLEDIILRYMSSYELSDLGIYGYAISTSASLREAYKIAETYQRLAVENYGIESYCESDRLYFSPVIPDAMTPLIVPISDDLVTGKWRSLHQLMPGSTDFSKIRIELSYPAPAYAESYTEIFDCPVRFNAQKTSISLPLSWLDRPIKTADRDMARLCKAECENIFHSLGAEDAIVDKVRYFLLSKKGRFAKLEDTAKELCVSPRTLRAHLADLGTNYRAIVNSLRMELARQYLERTSMSIQEIAFLLDYSQASAFSRAFKKLNGCTPEAYKNGLQI